MPKKTAKNPYRKDSGAGKGAGYDLGEYATDRENAAAEREARAEANAASTRAYAEAIRSHNRRVEEALPKSKPKKRRAGKRETTNPRVGRQLEQLAAQGGY